MGKYIDADRLKAEIDRIEEDARKVRVSGTDKEAIGADGKVKLCLKLKSLIDSLQEEQPESSKGKFVFPNYLYARTVDNKTIDVSYAPQSLDAVEYIKNDPTE